MTRYQRRALAAAVFAFTFILFFEARGRRLLTLTVTDEKLGDPVALQAYFWQQIGMGATVLALGVLLLVTLRRQGQRLEFTRGEWIAFAAGLGILIGTAVSSWFQMR